MQSLLGGDLVCPAVPSGCENAPKENLPSCKSNICRNKGRCDFDTQSKAYADCVNTFKTSGAQALSSANCACDEEERGRVTIDVYINNTTNETFKLTGKAENWVIIGKKPKVCRLGDWVLAPPSSIAPKTAFLARAFSGKIGEDDECKGVSFFHVCFRYTSESSPGTTFTISLQRRRGYTGSSGLCPHWGKVSSSSTFSSSLEPSVPTFIDHSTYTFVISKTGGGPSDGCTTSPDSCPSGLYCSVSSSGNTCLSGCKTSPDSCPSGQVCSPSTRACIQSQKCSDNSDCSLEFVCTIPSGSSEGTCTPGCAVNGQDDNSRCKSGFVCVSGQCTSTGTNSNGSNTKLRKELLIAFGVVFLIVVVLGIVYMVYSNSTPTSSKTV